MGSGANFVGPVHMHTNGKGSVTESQTKYENPEDTIPGVRAAGKGMKRDYGRAHVNRTEKDQSQGRCFVGKGIEAGKASGCRLRTT